MALHLDRFDYVHLPTLRTSLTPLRSTVASHEADLSSGGPHCWLTSGRINSHTYPPCTALTTLGSTQSLSQRISHQQSNINCYRPQFRHHRAHSYLRISEKRFQKKDPRSSISMSHNTNSSPQKNARLMQRSKYLTR